MESKKKLRNKNTENHGMKPQKITEWIWQKPRNLDENNCGKICAKGVEKMWKNARKKHKKYV